MFVLTLVRIDVTKNVFYWTRVAMVVAQGSGMHRRHVKLFISFVHVFISNGSKVSRPRSSTNPISDYGSESGGRSSHAIAQSLSHWGARLASTLMTLTWRW